MIIKERRFMGLWVTPEVIARLITHDRGRMIRVLESSIPKDAEFIDIQYRIESRGFLLCFYHPSFDIVPDGYNIPIAYDTVFEFVDKVVDEGVDEVENDTPPSP